ncbi:MAG: hypothetical protein ABSD29_05470 [Verrucomicrobiota bacterium]
MKIQSRQPLAAVLFASVIKVSGPVLYVDVNFLAAGFFDDPKQHYGSGQHNKFPEHRCHEQRAVFLSSWDSTIKAGQKTKRET